MLPRRTLLAIFVLITLVHTDAAFAELPWTTWMSESLGPTQEDWFRYFHQKQERLANQCSTCVSGSGSSCVTKRCAFKPKAVTCTGPLELWQEIYYFPCACLETCGPAHRSLEGCYGWRHPQPYYIPNPTLSVETDLCLPTGRRQSWRFPDNRAEIILGMWE